jgi:hypothetical protein
MFCDMNQRKLYPACEGDEDIDCFDTIYNETRRQGIEKRTEKSIYLQVREWL